ncbi:MAG: SUMF1/EgtB/PvdO family nonheme iron enzyme [Saprospiraceae bacterium]|nr:SUMF1/EgtB/PvdO family nonheme iron enzyme [Saprospiraceae bacterium]
MTEPRKQYLTDQATGTDLLRYEDFQAALYDVVTQSETPLTVGIFGPWGSGKTSLMQMLRQRLEAEGVAARRTVWFTAWKYDRQDALWRAFILRVLDALYPRENEPANLPRNERPVLQKPGPREARLIELLNRLEESVYQAIDWEEIGPRAINWWQFISNTGKAGVETTANLSSLGLFTPLKKVLGGDDTPAEEIQKAAAAISRETKSYHRRQLQHMEEFEATFKEAVTLLDPQGTGRLVIFVDDLDRCLPEKALEVLEAIKLFLEVSGAVFVLGMDQTVIRQGIEARYAAAFRQERGAQGERVELPIQGDSYLQKIVQIPFHLPALAVEDVAEFIAQLNPQLSPRAQAVLAQGVYPNPRQVKRVLNILRLLRGVADRRFVDGEVIADALLVKTVIIQSQYPALYQLWRQYPTLVQTLEAEYARRPTSDEELLTGTTRAASRSPAGLETDAAATVPEAPAGGATRGGLLDEYLNNRSKYALLARLMTYPAESEAGSGASRARFTGLTRPQVAVYVRLAGAVESEPVPVDVPTDLLGDLLSGEEVQIRDAAGRLDSQEPATDGQLHQAARQQLLTILSNPQQPTRQRLSAGDALALIGDPRFHDQSGFYLPCDDLLGFVEIPAGQFRMGSPAGEDTSDDKREQPQHSLHLDSFYLARYPVTVAQFRLFVAQSGHKPANSSSLQGLANHPVRYASWYDAVAYGRWLTEQLPQWPGTPAALKLRDGWAVTLPSEAEWEKGARGVDGRSYPWGSDFDPDKANHKETGLDSTSAVGAFPGGASPFGLLDMSGNVWEWTRSLYKGYEYVPGDGREKIEDVQARDRFVLRGGSFVDGPDGQRCAARVDYDPLGVSGHFGFRVVVSPFLAHSGR